MRERLKNQEVWDKVSNLNAQLQRVKIRAIGKANKHYMRMQPQGLESNCLFGLHLVKPSDKSILITEGEYDAMAVHQATGVLAVSLPNGATHLPVLTLPFFDQFEKIYLWMDNDAAGQMNLGKIAEKLNSSRVYIVRSIYKDANEAMLLDEESIGRDIESSRTLLHDNLLNFSLLKSQVKDKMQNYLLD